MERISALDLQQSGSLRISSSTELRWNNAQLHFFNLDHDITYYVSGVVADINNAYWLDDKKLLLVVGANACVYLIDSRAKAVLQTKRFTDPVDTIYFDADSELLLLRSESAVEVINVDKRSSLARLEVNFGGAGNLIITADQRNIGFSTNSSFRVYSLATGAFKMEFKDKNFALRKAKQLDNDTWITLSQDDRVQWWSADGQLITNLQGTASIQEGVLLLDNGNLLVTDGSREVREIDTKGNVVSSVGTSTNWRPARAAIEALTGAARQLISNKQQVDMAFELRGNVLDFPHYFNVLGMSVDGVGYNGNKVLSGGSVKRGEVGNKRIWNFFYRPKTGQLINQFTSVMRESASNDTSLTELKEQWQQAQDKLRKSAKLRGIKGWITFLIALGAGGYGYWQNGLDVQQHLDFWIPGAVAAVALLLALLDWGSKSNAGKQIAELDSAMACLDKVHSLVKVVKSRVKEYRMHLLSQVPQVGDERPSDKQMASHITQLLEGKLRNIALEECGLDEADVNSTDAEGNPIRTYINEPAYLQFSDPSEIPRGLTPDNLVSFFLGPKNEPIFAVQFIQFFFLGAKKIDAFTCFYDFINDEMVANESHTFYYRDVTNISKRQLDLTDTDSFADRLAKAKVCIEMKLVVASSDNIRINIATEETYRMINENVADTAAEQLEERLRNIDDEINRIESSEDLSQEEKDEEIADLKATRAQQKAEFERRIDENNSSNEGTSQQIIQHVRGRLRELKEA